MKVRLFFYLMVLLLASHVSYSQDSCRYTISLITLSPGDELYSVFGHSALRVKDDSTKDDLVYNYGTFDFSEPDFLTKFINGKLLYYVSNEEFIPFIQYYQSEKRTITEQVLNLDCNEKRKVVAFLYNNLQGSNKFYKYDFISDNCTTRLRDLISINTNSKPAFKRIVASNAYYRKLLHADLDYHDHQWIKLGIDLLLGSRTDKVMDNNQVMFLPDYLMSTLGSSQIDGRPAVIKKNNLSGLEADPVVKNIWFYPVVIFTVFVLLILWLSILKKPKINRVLTWIDSIFFFLFGATGLVLIYLWTVSDQLNYRENYNLIWALPTHFIFSFLSYKKYNWVRLYFLTTMCINVFLILIWLMIPQHLNYSLLPLILILSYRCWIRYKFFKRGASYAGKDF